MKPASGILIFVFLSVHLFEVHGQEIFRFERMGSEDGLSQNTAFSILFDSKGFMWIGTMNGLNRYDGYEFKIYRSSSGNGNNFTNNRVTRLWEDRKGFIWLETYDGYYHFFNPESEILTSLPDYEGSEVRNGAMQIFLQYSDDIIFLGSAGSGLYCLKYDPELRTYTSRQYPGNASGNPTDNIIRFLHRDSGGNLWIGTSMGVSYASAVNVIDGTPLFVHLFDGSFSSVCETGNELWFGTGDHILAYNKVSHRTHQIALPTGLMHGKITRLFLTRNGMILVGIEGSGFFITNSLGTEWKEIKFHSRNPGSIYEDRSGNVWLTAVEFGATRLDVNTLVTKYYELTPEEIRPLTDLERPQFFEDSKGNLWLGLHGSGLAIYKRDDDRFEFFRNNPGNRNTISSNFVHCVAEDRNGQLWVGTGQVEGGIEKVILRNDAFGHYKPVKNSSDILDNVARAILEDNNKNLWVATKAGHLFLYDSTLKQINEFLSLPGLGHGSLRNITYSLFLDDRNYLWVGSKGYGLAVTTAPLKKTAGNYSDIKFRRYEYSASDTTSLSNNNIYSICQDKKGNIWIGTYGNGLNLVKDPYGRETKFIRINQQNSNISSNLIRHLLVDSSGNLWVASAFGLNMLENDNIELENFRFKVFLRNTMDDNSLVYNDVIHIFEDSRKRLWFGTFGGGADMIEDPGNPVFKHFGSDIMSGYGIIFGILEDGRGNIWLSTENGLIRLDPLAGLSEIYNTFNGLGFNNFSENTCYRRSNGSLVFGGNLGFEIINPDRISLNFPVKNIELTKFLVFNREVSTFQKDSPLEKSISFSDDIRLKHTQSSFSIEFSALDFLDPGKIEYSYKLDNFDRSWNNAGNQNRATYTNLTHGKYVFRVKSVERNGRSTSNERILRITITPPWWKTVPAYILYCVLLTIIVISIYKTVTRINRYKNALVIEKKVNEYKLQFFTNISHEIRTPLTLIIGPLEDMLAGSDVSNRKKVQMEIMLKNARRMLQLTNQLLDFRKVQNNKMVLKVKKINIVAFTREIYESFIPLADHKGITCSFGSKVDSFIIYADPNKLDTVIYNIISNALKFTGTGKRVSVRIDETEATGSIDISVKDEGPGIPQKDLADIFTRYTILSNQELAGTGIGLSLSYELVKLHKGSIVVNSEMGKGSTFTIRLLKGSGHFASYPLSDTEESDSPGKAVDHKYEVIDEMNGIDEEEQPLQDAQDKNIILVIEDNQEILNYICQSLKSYFMCIGARNGSEGLHLARTLNPDLVITDIMMPGIDGMEMTRLLKEDFNTSHIPVIMLTSKSDLKDQIEGIETGAEAYIVKPFSMEYLKTVAGNLLSQRARVIARFMSKKPAETELPAINSKDEEFLNKLVSYIGEKCSGECSVESLAEHLNVSRTVFYNKIKGLTGLSPLEFQRKIKLKMASRLIENGFNVSEAAFKTGFTDVKYFSRLFKHQFGHPPSHHKSETQVTSDQ